MAGTTYNINQIRDINTNYDAMSQAAPPPGKRDALGAGFEAAKTGLTTALPYAFKKATGSATPDDDARFQQEVQASAERQNKMLPGGPKSIFSGDPLGGAVETLAYGAPQMASEIAGGAVGAAGGAALGAEGGPLGALGGGLAGLAGGALATGAVAYPQYVGSNAIAASDNGQQALTQEAAQRSMLAAGGQSVLDAGLSAVGVKALSGKGILSHGFTGNLLQRGAKGAVEGGALGAADQVARGVGTQYASGKDLTSDQSLQEDLEGAGVGGIFGVAAGGAGGAFSKAKAKAKTVDPNLLKPADSGPDGTTSDVTNPIKLLSGATYSPDELHPDYSPNPEVNNGLALPAPGAPPEPPTIFAENPTKKLTGPPDQPVADPNQNNPSASPNPQGPPGLLAHGQVGRTDGVPDHFGGNGIAPANDLPPAAPQVLPTDEVKGLFTQTNIAAELRPQGETGYDPHMQAVTSALTKSLGENNPDGADAYIARKTKELKAQDGVEDPAILAKKQAILDKATQVVQAYREHMADAMQREEALTNPNIQTPPDTLHPAVASALANAPDHPKAATQPPVMVDPVQHAKMIRDAEKEAVKAHEHEQALQDAMEKQRQRAADQTQKAQEAAHAQRMAMVEHSNRTNLIDAALNDPKINDPAGWVIAHLKRYNFDNKDLTPLERQRIAEHERNNLRLDGAEPMGNPKEGEDVPRAERAPESPDFANSDQTRMFDKNGKVLPKVRQEGPSNKDMETERAKAHTASEAISNVRAEIEAKPDAPNSEVVDAIAHGIRQITDNVPAKDRLEALSVLKNEHGERLFNAAMERADSMKDEGGKPASETNKDKIQPTQPETKAEPKPEDPEVTKAKAMIAVRDRAVEAFKNGYLTDPQRRMVEAAIERGDISPEEIHKHIDDMVAKSGDRAETPAPRKTLTLQEASPETNFGTKTEYTPEDYKGLRERLDASLKSGAIGHIMYETLAKAMMKRDIPPERLRATLDRKDAEAKGRAPNKLDTNRRGFLGGLLASPVLAKAGEVSAKDSPVVSKLRDMLRSGAKNSDILKYVVANTKDPANRKLAQRLLMFKGLDAIDRYTVRSANEEGRLRSSDLPEGRLGNDMREGLGEGETAAHALTNVDTETGTTYMALRDHLTDPSIDGLTEEAFLHETEHAVLAQTIDNLKDYVPTGNVVVDRAVANIKALFDSVSKGISGRMSDDLISKTYSNELSAGIIQFMRDPDEAFAWFGASPELREFMKSIDPNGELVPPKSPRLTFWDKFIGYIKDIFGIKDPETVTAFDALQKAHDEVLKATATLEPDFQTNPKNAERVARNPNKMFVGKDAQGADRGRLAEAKMREAAGQDAGWHSDIHEETGWHKTPGGDWAYEVSDHDAGFHTAFKDIPDGEHKLSDVFSAPEAFHAYPELKDIVFKKEDLGDRVGGRFDASTNTIIVSSRMPESEVKNTVLHEMQHWVQNKEDFARGGNENNQVSTSKTLDKLHAFYKDRIDSLQSSYDRLRNMVGDDMSHSNIREYYERSGMDPKEASRMATRERNNVVMAYRTAQDRLKYVEQFREHADTVDAAAAQTRKSTADIKSTADTHSQMMEATSAHVAKLAEEYKKAKDAGATPEELASIRQQYDQIKQAYAQFSRAAQNRVEQSRGKRAQSEAVLDVSRKDMNASGLGTDAYNNLAGEVQARATGDSANLDAYQRKNRNPYTDQGVKPEHQLVTRDKVANDSVRSPEEHDEPVEHLTNAMNRPDNKPGELPKNPMARGAADVALNMNDTTRRTMLNLRTMEQLAERFKHLPMIKAIKDMLDVQARERDDLIRAGGIIHHLGRALPKDEQDKLSLVFDAERHQVDVLDPTARTNPDNSPEANDIHARFAALSPAAQDVYKQMIDAGKAKADTAKKIYAETINGMTNLDEGTKKRLISQMEAKFSRPVYFPHVWDGDFITIGKSDEFRKAEAAGDYDTMEKLRTDGNHYIVRASKTAADQRALIQALRGEGMDVNIKKREQFQPSTDIVPDKFMRVVNQGLDDHIRANPDMAEGLRGMKEMLNETRYAMMPDGSQLANKFKRKGVQGFETDALGVFARTTKRDADYLTKLKYNTGVRQELDNLSVKARENQSNADMDVSEQMRKHFNSLGKYHNSSASKILNNLTYAYYLGMSPSFMVMHLMQTPMITAPYLGARFDAAKVTAALGQAGAEGVANYRRLMQNEGNEQIFGKTADEKEALKYAATRGLFQATQAHSLMIDAAGGGKMDHIASAAMHVASFLPHHTERFNRLVTFQAAYRLAMAHPEVIPALDAETHAKATELTPGKFDLNPQQLAAARFAQDTVNTTHVDYSGHNAAHIMQPGVVPFGEVMFQFQKYQQGMLSILGDSLADLFSKKPAAEKWVAGKTLAGILTSHAAVTGLMGLPLVGTAVMLSNIYHKFFGDKDKPFDGDDALQKKMIDTFGPTWGEVALRGMLYAPGIKQIAPVDVTDRLGLGDVLAPTRQVGKINHDEWLKYIGSIAGGPSGSLLGQFADAYDYHEHGDDWKASEELMPKVMRDISRTIRFYNEGVTSKSGNEVISAEDMQKGPAFAQLAGFEPQNMQETYANRRAVQNAQAELQERRKVLLKEATDARSSGDQARLQRVMADIQRFNNVRSQEGTYSMRIKGGEIMRSFKTRQKNNASLDHGVALKHSQQDLGMYSLGEGTGDEQSSE